MGKDSYVTMLKQEKQFLFMICANIVSRFGDSIDAIAYSWMVYGLTGSKAWLAMTFGVNMLPTILIQPFSGALTEFLNKKWVIVLCDIARGAVVMITGGLLLMGILQPWQVLAMTFLNSCFETLRIPNGLAVIPEILGKEHYKEGISFNEGASRTSELLGLGAAGAVIGWFGAGGALVVDALTFFLSALLLSFLRPAKALKKREKLNISGYLASMKDGFTYFKTSQLMKMVCFVCILLNVILIPIENLQAAYIQEYLRLDVFAMSVGSTAVTIGTILGSFSLPFLSKRIPLKRIVTVGGVLIGLLYFVYLGVGVFPWKVGKYIGYFLAAFCFGFINSLIGVGVQVAFISRIPDELLGRTGGIFNALACSSVPATSFALAAVSPFLTMKEIYLVMGCVTIFMFLLVGRLKGIRELEDL